MQPIYLDYCATTPVDPSVVEAMLPYFSTVYGNPSSGHAAGQTAAQAVLNARNQVARLLGVEADDRTGAREITFTSGATEANNLAIKGVLELAERGRHVITQATEHRAVLDTCRQLADAGRCDLTVLPVNRHGQVSPEQVESAIRPDTVLVSLMWANNETGTLLPMDAIGQVCRRHGVPLHSDATQAVGKVPIDLSATPVDLLSLSAHKFYGPKGVGALFTRKRNPRVRIAPQLHGGGHERGVRSGTLNVPGIVGMGAAAELCSQHLHSEMERTARLRDRFEATVRSAGDVLVNGDPANRLPNVSNLSFVGIHAEKLAPMLGDLMVSTGSACKSASLEASHVLRSMGLEPALALQSIRVSVGRPTTEAEVDQAAAAVLRIVQHLRQPVASA